MFYRCPIGQQWPNPSVCFFFLTSLLQGWKRRQHQFGNDELPFINPKVREGWRFAAGDKAGGNLDIIHHWHGGTQSKLLLLYLEKKDGTNNNTVESNISHILSSAELQEQIIHCRETIYMSWKTLMHLMYWEPLSLSVCTWNILENGLCLSSVPVVRSPWDGCRGIQLYMRNQRTDASQESFVVVMWRDKRVSWMLLAELYYKVVLCHIPTQLIQSCNASWEDGGKTAFMWLDYCRAV